MEYTCPACAKLNRRCQSCRLRRCRGASVAGAVCRAPCCAVSDPRMLRRHKFVDGVVVVCANHSAVAGRRPLTWPEFERELLPAALAS